MQKQHAGQASLHDITRKLYSPKTIIIDGSMKQKKWLWKQDDIVREFLK